MYDKSGILISVSILLAIVLFAGTAFACDGGCQSDSDCGKNHCSQLYTDVCNGKKLVDYNGNGAYNVLLVEKDCQKLCGSDHVCIDCTPDCSPPSNNEICVAGQCGAECDSTHSCAPAISGDSCKFGEGCCDLSSCSCGYSQTEYCPVPGTVKDGMCYYGTRSCGESGCGLSKAAISEGQTCDPNDGPKGEGNNCSQTYNDQCDSKKFIDYNQNGVFDSILVQNSCNTPGCVPECPAPEVAAKCQKGVCGAGCDSQNACSPTIVDDTCKYADECDLQTCGCSFSQSQFCPTPGTTSNGVCYWGTRGCTESGCTLKTSTMNGNQTCDPDDGPVPGTPDTQSPTAPIVQISVNGNTVTLTWSGATDNVGIDNYVVFRSEDGTTFSSISGRLGSGISSYSDLGLGNGVHYYFVQAFDAAGNYATSATVSATVGSVPQPVSPTQSGGFFFSSGPSVTVKCTQNWECSLWSDCLINGSRTRTCGDQSRCNNQTGKPTEVQDCTYTPLVQCQENWVCNDWLDCSNNTQSRVCGDLNNCGTSVNKPAEIQACQSGTGITGFFGLLQLSPLMWVLLLLLIIAIITTIVRVFVR